MRRSYCLPLPKVRWLCQCLVTRLAAMATHDDPARNDRELRVVDLADLAGVAARRAAGNGLMAVAVAVAGWSGGFTSDQISNRCCVGVERVDGGNLTLLSDKQAEAESRSTVCRPQAQQERRWGLEDVDEHVDDLR